MDFIEWMKAAEENDLRVYEAIGILLNGGSNDHYEYTSTGVNVIDYNSWDIESKPFTFEQLDNPKEALVVILAKEEELRKIAREKEKDSRIQVEKDLQVLKDAEELAEYTRLRAKFEKEDA